MSDDGYRVHHLEVVLPRRLPIGRINDAIFDLVEEWVRDDEMAALNYRGSELLDLDAPKEES